MESDAPMVSGDLNKIICQECGLPLNVYSYEKINPNTDEEKIKIKLFCQNLDHKTINELDFEDYQALINISMLNKCKCISCNKLLLNKDDSPNYCYICKKIICSDCLENKHDKGHKNIFQYKELDNKCLNHFGDKNEFEYYCLICKKKLCSDCILKNVEHCTEHKVKEISSVKRDIIKPIVNIQKEQENNINNKNILIKKLKNLENKINFNDFLEKEKYNYFHLFLDNNNSILSNNNQIKNEQGISLSLINNSINNNNVANKQDINQINNNINNNNINDNKGINGVNVLYLDENIKYGSSEIINDCKRIQIQTQGSVILINDLINFDFTLKNLIKSKTKSKFILIVNGSSADNAVNLIKKNNYTSLFISGIIYTGNLNKYEKIKEKHSDIIGTICIDCESIINFINNAFQKTKCEKYNINNSLINYYLYKTEYFPLHKEISLFYGDESENTFTAHYQMINDFIQKENYPNNIKENFLRCSQNFIELKNKNYTKIIICYLKDDNFSKILNTLLNKKDYSIYTKIGYFVGNLMHSLVQYGKKAKKAINSGTTFYKGLQLNIIELLEYLKNEMNIITFPYFLSMVTKKDFAENTSKRNISDKTRKTKEFYSVIMKINYLYDSGYEPSAFNLKDLAQYPDEEEYILLPFTFLELKKVNIDSNKFTADIELDIIGKKEILENKIKESKTVEHNKKNKIMVIK